MGCISSNQSSTKPIMNEVDEMLEDEKRKAQYQHKILLLGTGESGKSTVVKQIKLLYKVAISKQELAEYVEAIRRNVIDAIQCLLEASTTLSVTLNNSELQGDFDTLKDLDGSAQLTPELGNKVWSLWQDLGIQTVFQRRGEYWNMDATPYYLNECLRIAEEGFEPTEEDMVMTRVRTTGIVVTEVTEPPHIYQVVDVGGQRSERRKWIHCFDDVRAIIFLEGLAGYNQVLFEDNTMNRMHESLNLFTEIVKNPIFKSTPIFVFLNKKDLFEEMIPKHPLKKCFPEYTGADGDVQAAIKFIENKYRAIMQECIPNKAVYIHVIAARLRMDMKISFGEIRETLKKLYPVKK